MKNIVICVDLNEDSLKTLEAIQGKFDLSNSTVHLVYVYEIHISNVEFTPVVYPSSDQYLEIEKNVLGMLKNFSDKLHLKSDQVQMKCIFDLSKESALNNYLTTVSSDVVVLATRGKHGIAGFFASSLADFLCKYAPCDVFVLRPNHETK
jgi:nucleotide-binding universal stress UspA family protein